MKTSNLDIFLCIIEILVYICVVTIPLAIWKVIDLLMYLFLGGS